MKIFGKKIYGIIQELKNMPNYTLFSKYRIYKVVVDWQRSTVIGFFIKYELNEPIYKIKELDRIREFLCFLGLAFNLGYRFSSDTFDCDNCKDFVSLLSLLEKNPSEENEYSRRCAVELVYYYTHGFKKFDDCYSEMIRENFFELPKEEKYYDILFMCYKMYRYSEIPTLIDSILEEQIKRINKRHDIFKSLNVKNELLIRSTSGCYDVTFQNIKEDEKESIHQICEQCGEELQSFIFNEDKQIIGYRSERNNNFEYVRIGELEIENQVDILNCIRTIIRKVNQTISDDITLEDAHKDRYFKLEDNILIYANGSEFKVIYDNYEAMYNVISTNKSEVEKSIVRAFYILYANFIKEKYPDIIYTDSKSIMKLRSNPELKYINSKLVEDVLHYIIYDIMPDIEQNTFRILSNFIEKHALNPNVKIAYDSNYIIDGKLINYISDAEVEKCYLLKLEAGKIYPLENGKIIETFNNTMEYTTYYNMINSNIEKLKDIGINYANSSIKFYLPSEVIVTNKQGQNGMYDVVGNIYDTVGRKEITDDFLMNLNNKDFAKIIMNLYSEFGKSFIGNKDITLDDKLNPYVSLASKDLQIQSSNKNSAQHLVDVLGKKGFIPFDYLMNTHLRSKEYISSVYNSLENYCDRHDYYYLNGQECPMCSEKTIYIDEKCIEKFEEVYRDGIATHYKYDYDNCLKVYNEFNIDLKLDEIKKDIDRLVNRTTFIDRDILSQNLFLPIKTVFGVDKKTGRKRFLGYLYKMRCNQNIDSMEDCVRLDNYNSLNTNPRIMGCLRIIEQYNNLKEKGYGFTREFGSVFISKNYKRQVQFINPEFIKKRYKFKDSDNYVLEYIKNVIEHDECLCIEKDLRGKSLEKVKEILRSLIDSNTNYCPYHNLYYSSFDSFCPKCIDKDTQSKIKTMTVTSDEISTWKQINEGGESFIYELKRGGQYAKIFKEDVSFAFKKVIISKILAKREQIKNINKRQEKFEFVVPDKIISSSETGEIIGYTEKPILNANQLNTLKNRDAVEKLGLSLQDKLTILTNLGEGIKCLHEELNIFIGDLNGRNILFDKNFKIYFVDFDGMGIDDITPEFFTDGYVDPIAKKNHTLSMKDDWYSFTILVFYYLTYVHPFNGTYKVKNGNVETTLDVVAKMEKKLSLMGNHGAKIPEIAEDWSWMSKKLKKSFLNTFEGNLREDITPYLKEHYKKINNNVEIKGPEIMFDVEEVNVFFEDVDKVITENVAIKSNFIFVKTGNFVRSFKCPNCDDIKNAIVSDDQDLVVVIYEKELAVYDTKFGKKLYDAQIDDNINVRLNDRTLYHDCGEDSDVDKIYKVIFKDNEKVERVAIKFIQEKHTIAFNVIKNEKFVVIKQMDGTPTIFCNNQKFFELKGSNVEFYNIIYDEQTKNWLVFSEEGQAIVIYPNGKFKELNINKFNKYKVDNIVFTRGKIFVPVYDLLYMYNVETDEEKNFFGKGNTINAYSKVYINNEGFYVITDGKMYKYTSKHNSNTES